MSDLSEFGAGSDAPDEPDRADEATIDEQCIAVKDNAERCQNAVSHMTDDPFCSSHSNAEDVTRIDDPELRTFVVALDEYHYQQMQASPFVEIEERMDCATMDHLAYIRVRRESDDA